MAFPFTRSLTAESYDQFNFFHRTSFRHLWGACKTRTIHPTTYIADLESDLINAIKRTKEFENPNLFESKIFFIPITVTSGIANSSAIYTQGVWWHCIYCTLTVLVLLPARGWRCCDYFRWYSSTGLTIIFLENHYNGVIMGAMASQITSLTIVYSIVYSDADQRKRQSSASLAFLRGIHRGPVNSPHKWPVTRKMFPFDDVIMWETAVSTDITGTF